MTSSEKMVSTLGQMQVPNGTGPGVRRSKRPLLASRTRCNVLWKPPKFCNKVKIGIQVQFGNKCQRVKWDGQVGNGHFSELPIFPGLKFLFLNMYFGEGKEGRVKYSQYSDWQY